MSPSKQPSIKEAVKENMRERQIKCEKVKKRLDKYCEGMFYGEIRLFFEKGKIVNLKEIRNVKP